MKTILFFISMLFVGNIALHAQPKKIEIKIKKDYQLKGNVKEVVNNTTDMVLKFTPEGYLQFSGFLKNGELQGRTYTYDKAGHMLKDNNYWNKYTYIYTYNARGQMVKVEWMVGKECNSITSFLYDMNGKARQEVLEYTNGVKAIYTLKNRYDAQKRLIKIERFEPYNESPLTTDITYLPNGWTRHIQRDDSSETVTEYDNKGRERSSIVKQFSTNKSMKFSRKYDINDNLVESLSNFATSTLYTYNNQSELIIQEDTALDGKKTKITYTYTKHDAKGNWTERTVDNNGKQTTETRTIEYYN